MGKIREGILYLFFGALTFLLAIGTFAFLNIVLDINELIANALSWAVGVTFSFFTTRKWVFQMPALDMARSMAQICSFYGARVATLILQELLLYILIETMGCKVLYAKASTEFINIVLNYVVSKWIVFKK